MKDKYYMIDSKRLADAILWVSGIKYFTYDSDKYEGQQMFSFENTEEFRSVLADLNKLKRQYKNK